MRLAKAAEEIKLADKFDSIVINDNLEQAVNEVFSLVSGFIQNG